MPCLQKNGAVTPQYRQRLCPAGQGRFFYAVFAQLAEQLSPKTTGRWFESTRMKTKTFCKQKTASVSLRWRSFYGRGWITQAAHLKKPRRGFFPRRTVRRVDAVQIHPPSLREGYYKTETPVPGSDTGVLGGRGWIRTTEAEKQQIYSLSPLATREHAHIQFCSPWIACIYYHPDDSLSTSFAEFLDFCAESKNTKAKAAQKSTFLSGFLELVTGVEPATH